MEAADGKEGNMTNPLFGRFDDMVESLMRPIPKPTATPSVAVLYSGDGRLEQAARDAGLEVAYIHNPASYREIFDFRKIPSFDFVVAAMPDAPAERNDAFQFVMRFVRVRRPDAFLLVGTEQPGDAEFLSLVRQETNPYGYEVASFGASSGVPENDALAFLVGMLYLNPVELSIFSAEWEHDVRPALEVMVGRVGRAVKGEGWV